MKTILKSFEIAYHVPGGGRIRTIKAINKNQALRDFLKWAEGYDTERIYEFEWIEEFIPRPIENIMSDWY